MRNIRGFSFNFAMLTEKELCAMLRVSRQTLSTWRKKNGLPYVQVCPTNLNRGIRYSAHAVRIWLLMNSRNNMAASDMLAEYENSPEVIAALRKDTAYNKRSKKDKTISLALMARTNAAKPAKKKAPRGKYWIPRRKKKKK